MSPIDADLQDAYPDHWESLRSARLKLATRFPADTPWLQEPTPCCEWCGRPNGETVPLYDEGVWETAIDPDGESGVWVLRIDGGEVVQRTRPEPHRDENYELTETILTCAHLCQDPRCGDPSHLRALCQRCHLQYDQQVHQQRRRAHIQAEIRGQQRLVGKGGCDARRPD